MTEHLNQPGFAPTRREVVYGMAALAAAAITVSPLGAARAAVPVPPVPPEFLAVSSRLTGVVLDQTYQDQASQIWVALVPLYGADRLGTVIEVVQATADETQFGPALRSREVFDVGQALVRTWYTGSPDAKPKSVLFYDPALAWTVCAFTKPAANCGGVTGYWEKPWSEPKQGSESKQEARS